MAWKSNFRARYDRFSKQILVLRHRCGEEVTPLNFTREKEVLIVLFSNIKNAKAPRENKSKQGGEKSTSPDILASVTINLLLTAFNVISSHMFQMCLCLRPLKTNGFFSELFTPATTPPSTHTHSETHTETHTL